MSAAPEDMVASAAIERAMSTYEQMRDRDHHDVVQARKALTEYIYGLINEGELDEARLAVQGLIYLAHRKRDAVSQSTRAQTSG